MKLLRAALLALLGMGLGGALAGQQRPADAPPVVEAKKDVVVTWTLGGQVWDFKAIATTYEPVKGVFDPLTNEAVWTLQMVKDLEPGAVALHKDMQGSPFLPYFLNAERGVIAKDAKVLTSLISGKMGDTVQIAVQLPDKETLDKIKLVRIERRTNVGF